MNQLFLLKQIMKKEDIKLISQLEANAISAIIYEDKNSGSGHIKI